MSERPKPNPNFTGSSAQKTALKRAESKAKAWLDTNPAKAKAKGPNPTQSDVLAVLREIGAGNWPTQARPNVTDTGKPVPGMCFGLVFALGQGAQVSNVTEAFPHVAELLTRWCRATLPRTKKGKMFPFSSLQVNFNYAAIKHVDGNNIGPSYIVSIGSHSGGKLWTADQGVIDCKGKWKLFDGNKEHGTRPFKQIKHAQGPGERISFIAFAHGQYNKLDKYNAKRLKELGFTAARSDRKEEEFFERFRIEKSYLTEKHNASFKKELAKRRKENDPSKTLGVGSVAIECYGRQADRGGGWFAFNQHGNTANDLPSEVLNLKPNSVGIWLAECVLKKKTNALSLIRHERIDLYNDKSLANTRKLAQRVAAMAPNTIVLIGIADTACAASRPLTPSVYKTLQVLGAPEDMPPIGYRQAWGMIGFKGARGTALTAMGTRSTLLRLDATFAWKGDKLSLTVGAPPDLTSIIDVVTGGGQDSAVANDEAEADVSKSKLSTTTMTTTTKKKDHRTSSKTTPKRTASKTKAKAKMETKKATKKRGRGGEENEQENEQGEIFEVLKIVDERKRPHQYKVRWKGYDESEDTWEDASNLVSAKEAVEAFKNNPANGKRKTQQPAKKRARKR